MKKSGVQVLKQAMAQLADSGVELISKERHRTMKMIGKSGQLYVIEEGGRFAHGTLLNFIEGDDGKIRFSCLVDGEYTEGFLTESDMPFLGQVTTSEQGQEENQREILKGLAEIKAALIPQKIMLNGHPMPENLYRIENGIIYCEIWSADL